MCLNRWIRRKIHAYLLLDAFLNFPCVDAAGTSSCSWLLAGAPLLCPFASLQPVEKKGMREREEAVEGMASE